MTMIERRPMIILRSIHLTKRTNKLFSFILLVLIYIQNKIAKDVQEEHKICKSIKQHEKVDNNSYKAILNLNDTKD